MNEANSRYCTNCGLPVSGDVAYCRQCGWPVIAGPKERVRQVATILNELRIDPMRSAIPAQAHAGLKAHYTRELQSFVVPRSAAPSRRAPTPAPRVGTAGRERKPREPMDWSWLADQQANLLLFAGAFLTIVAALIYVGYSEQAVSGALKMTLLAGYTLAFIAAGAACLRHPRVVMAGHVFLGVGAVMLPMNFAAAREFFGEGDLSAESMWLAGSIVSGAFYAAVARIGLGRGYAIASGVAFVSAAIAAAVAFDVAAEWAAIVVIAASALLLAPMLFGDDVTRRRIGDIWQFHAHAAALGAVLLAIALAVYTEAEVGTEVSTRWFLPLTFVAFTTFAVIPMLRTRRFEFGIEAAAGFGALVLGVVYVFDAPAEAYAIAVAAIAVAFGVARLVARRADVARVLPKAYDEALYVFGVIGALTATLVALAVLQASLDEELAYDLTTRWYLPATFALIAAFFAIDAFAARERFGFAAMLASAGALLPSLAFAFDVRAEYYAFFFLVPAAALIAVVRWSADTAAVHADWRDDASWGARIASTAGVAIALAAAYVSMLPEFAFEPQFTAFLPVALALAVAVAAVDASRIARVETSAAFFALLAAAIVSIPYVYDAPAAHYGAAFAAAAIAVVSLRVAGLSWLDARTRDAIAVGALVLATVPFEYAYADAARIGAAVHFVAALAFALAAIARAPRHGSRALRMVVTPDVAWLYASGGALTIGYVFALRSMPAPEGAEAGSLAIPFAMLAAGLAVIGAGARRWLPDVRGHVYVMSLLVALISISMSPDAVALAPLLTAFVALYAALALFEDAPIVATPSAVFGLLAVVAWREHLGAPSEWLPIAFSAIGVAAYAAAIAIRGIHREWNVALRVSGAAYALIAPVAGFVALAVESPDVDFAQSAVYQWSTLAVVAAGGLAVVEAALSGRRWIIVPASATLVVALLLQVGRFEPENVQAYTLIVGAYLVLLGAFGLSRFRLIAGAESSGTYLEALGAATIMFPSFVQSLDGAWTYQLVLFAEAILFLALSVTFRRQGMLTAALGALVLVAGRATFDAINAMPNWIVAMLGGALLLAAGMAVLVARDRWMQWQETVLGWWSDAPERGANGGAM